MNFMHMKTVGLEIVSPSEEINHSHHFCPRDKYMETEEKEQQYFVHVFKSPKSPCWLFNAVLIVGLKMS